MLTREQFEVYRPLDNDLNILYHNLIEMREIAVRLKENDLLPSHVQAILREIECGATVNRWCEEINHGRNVVWSQMEVAKKAS